MQGHEDDEVTNDLFLFLILTSNQGSEVPYCHGLDSKLITVNRGTGRTGPVPRFYIQSISITRKTFPYYGNGQNYGNWISQPFSTIFQCYGRGSFSSAV